MKMAFPIITSGHDVIIPLSIRSPRVALLICSPGLIIFLACFLALISVALYLTFKKREK